MLFALHIVHGVQGDQHHAVPSLTNTWPIAEIGLCFDMCAIGSLSAHLEDASSSAGAWAFFRASSHLLLGGVRGLAREGANTKLVSSAFSQLFTKGVISFTR